MGKNTKQRQGDNLYPIKEDARIMNWFSYTMLWLGGCISIGTLTMGAAQLNNGLNLLQVFIAVLVGSVILVIGIAFNDLFGYATGAPYAVQLKSAYGTKGAIVPTMIRGLPAIVWYGFQTWLGGSAINQISIALFGYNNVVLYFILFQILQIYLSCKGFKGIKWVENVGGMVIVIAMFYMLHVCVTQYWDKIGNELIHLKGSWGMPFFAAIMAFFGNSTTVMLNASDYSRELKTGYSTSKRGWAYFIAMVPTTVLLGLIGAMSTTATGIANPINAFAQMVDNKVMLIVTLLFILFAQITTNLASNVVPPAYAFMDAFNMKHRTAVILVGILAVATFPWVLTNDSSAAGLALFVKIYTAFFSPIFAIMIVDYYILHKGRYDEDKLKDLYAADGYHEGLNWAAIIATIIGAAIGLFNVDISFFTATIPTALIFYALMKYLPSAKPFRRGTTFDKLR